MTQSTGENFYLCINGTIWEIYCDALNFFQRQYNDLKALQDKDYLQIPLLQDQLTGNDYLFYIKSAGLEERTRLTRHFQAKKIGALFSKYLYILALQV